MPRGISINVGLNLPDQNRYPPLESLRGCENDAHAMADLARARRFEVREPLLGADATVGNVTNAVRDAAKRLHDGDMLLLTFSGHGSRLPRGKDPAGTLNALLRPDAESDQTWCLFDRQLIDDELFAEWKGFDPGVRILVISDSCFSGTVAKNLTIPNALALPATNDPPLERGLDPVTAAAAFDKLKDDYVMLQAKFKDKCEQVEASLILLAACQDCEKALDGEPNGRFTTAVLDVWDEGRFQGNYIDFHAAVFRRVRKDQRPNYMKLGAPMTSFDLGTPFTL